MQFRLLGPLEVEDDGAPLRVGGAKQRVLLAALLLRANRPVSRERLIEELWGESAPASAAHRLEEHVSRLRRLLHRNDARLLLSEAGGYVLRVSEEDVDAARVERLIRDAKDASPHDAAAGFREALALWRGSPLQDVAHDGLLLPEIRRLDELHVSAQEQLIEAELSRGRHGDVLGELEELVQDEPFRERPRALLMLALYRSGRQADALAAYQEARATFKGELGIEPSRELRELEQAILQQDESLELFEPGGRPLPPPVPRARAGNMPRPTTSLVGREHEIGEVLAIIARGARFVTLTGPGGSGKTRLALEAANRAVADFTDGVFWVSLAALRDPTRVLDTIAQTLGSPDRVSAHIGDRRVLLLVDNFEQVIAAAPELAGLAHECPNLCVVVTSRELLQVSAETEYQVLPLADGEAIELFCLRGKVEPDDAVVELCGRLDNLPLAIEFASAQTPVLSPRQILERISQRLDLLKGAQDVESRQQNLRTTIEWSYELLSAEEQRLFARLAVFSGGWTLEAAEAVTEADIDTLQSLVEKSLVQHEDVRFSMLETTREFALERLADSEDAAALRLRHASYFADLAESAAPNLRGPDGGCWYATLAADLENLRAALAYTDHSADGALLLRLAGALGREFWMENGYLSEGRLWLEKALAHPDDLLRARSDALLGMTLVTRLEQEIGASNTYAKALLEHGRAHADPEATFLGLLNLGINAGADSRRAHKYFEAADKEARTFGNRTQLALVAGNLSNLELLDGSYARAFEHAEEAAAIQIADGRPRAVAVSSANAGAAARELGQFEVARNRLERALRIAVELGTSVLHEFGGLAALQLAEGRPDRAARLTGVTQAICEKGFVFEEFERRVYERTVAALREELDTETLCTALAEGRAMPLEDAVAFALEEPNNSRV
jgi:predicted ATPase/DNA-binding SARP family transcriptional activator